MKIKYLLLTLIFSFILIPGITKAEEIYTCDFKEKARLNAIASNITLSVDYVEKNNSVEFSVTLSNLHPELYIVDVVKNKTYRYDKNSANPKELRLSGYKDGVNLTYEVHTVNKICRETLLINKHMTIPPFNKYYKDPVCKGLGEVSLCKKWVRINYSYEEFKSQVNRYKKEHSNEPKPTDGSDYLFNIIQFYLKYYMYVLPGIILLGAGTIFIIDRKKEFRF